jgi:hypothetical protein
MNKRAVVCVCVCVCVCVVVYNTVCISEESLKTESQRPADVHAARVV